LLAHKANADAILAEDGFMAALCYNIQIWTNCFANWVTLEDGTKLIADISVLCPKVAQSTYATCRKFKELEFLDNPYSESGPRATWDPKTGHPRGNKKTAAKPTGTSTATSTAATAPPKAKAKAPQTSRYRGSNYDPNYQSNTDSDRERNEKERAKKT
jgi:hypothetical protein